MDQRSELGISPEIIAEAERFRVGKKFSQLKTHHDTLMRYSPDQISLLDSAEVCSLVLLARIVADANTSAVYFVDSPDQAHESLSRAHQIFEAIYHHPRVIEIAAGEQSKIGAAGELNTYPFITEMMRDQARYTRVLGHLSRNSVTLEQSTNLMHDAGQYDARYGISVLARFEYLDWSNSSVRRESKIDQIRQEYSRTLRAVTETNHERELYVSSIYIRAGLNFDFSMIFAGGKNILNMIKAKKITPKQALVEIVKPVFQERIYWTQ